VRARLVPFLLAGSAALLLALGCGRAGQGSDPLSHRSMFGAVLDRSPEDVRRLAQRGEGVNMRDQFDGATPVIRAAETGHWSSAEVLLDHGADIWAHHQSGVTVALASTMSDVPKGSREDQARLRVIQKLKARGYPGPMEAEEVLALDKAGQWPPPGAKR
jgi:hypothetical protein